MIVSNSQTKSGLRSLSAGEILFNDGDVAESLFIIQKGQIRLFKPKGRGFVEIGVLRSGEVIGEMAYFDEDGSGRKRSCSASAMGHVEVIEISFVAFAKTMQSLNPWFKTIINTLATRLRKSNVKVKELEDNQASLSYSGKHAGYEFLKPLDAMKIVGTLFLIVKAQGEFKDQNFIINKKQVVLYTSDFYQISESKLENILSILEKLQWLTIQNDQDGLPYILKFKNLEVLRQISLYYNTERHFPEDKKLRISDKCEAVLDRIYIQGESKLSDIPNLRIVDDIKPKFTKQYLLSEIFEELKAKNISVSIDHLGDAKNLGIFGEPIMISGKIFVETDFQKFLRMYPIIKFINMIKKLNAELGGN